MSGKKIPLLVKLGLSLGLILMTVWLCFFVAEKFFFDRLFYQKTGLYGYRYNRDSEFKISSSVNSFDKFLLTNRINDLSKLAQEIAHPTIANACFIPDSSLNKSRKFTRQQPLRIVIIGDSNTYGLGIRSNLRYSDQLEKKLNQLVPTEIYTLAEPGNSLEDDYALYLLAKDYLKPDFVIIGILENDLIFNSNKYPNSQWLRTKLQTICSQDIFAAQSDEFGAESWDSVLEIYRQSFLPHFANRCFLNQIATELGHDQNLRFFSFFDYRYLRSQAFDSIEVNNHRFLMTEYKNVLMKAGNKVIGYNPENGFFTYASAKEGHPSAAAHQKFAEIIFQEIILSLQTK